jgi:hypothetical protein
LIQVGLLHKKAMLDGKFRYRSANEKCHVGISSPSCCAWQIQGRGSRPGRYAEVLGRKVEPSFKRRSDGVIQATNGTAQVGRRVARRRKRSNPSS